MFTFIVVIMYTYFGTLSRDSLWGFFVCCGYAVLQFIELLELIGFIELLGFVELLEFIGFPLSAAVLR
jgi:hypothetical protein